MEFNAGFPQRYSLKFHSQAISVVTYQSALCFPKLHQGGLGFPRMHGASVAHSVSFWSSSWSSGHHWPICCGMNGVASGFFFFF